MLKDYFLWLLKLLTIIAIFITVPVFLISIIASSSKSLIAVNQVSEKNKIGVVEVKGIIQDSKKILKELYDFSNDKSIDGIILRVDSPGGAVGPSQEIYNAVKILKERKPIVASMGSLAASGGLYVALPASKIYAQAGTLTGSIGVIMQAPNFTRIADKVGLDVITVKSGKYKDVGNSFRTFTEEDREFLQTTIDDVYQDFRQAVIDSRSLPASEVDKFADGRVITGSQAVDYGLIDAEGNIYEAARAVYDLLGKSLPKSKDPKLVYRDDRFGKFAKIFEDFETLLDGFNLSSINHGMRAYYLAN